MQPKVSVCCVTYNQVSYIKASLDSFLMQETNFDFEIIIHDDASTDGTSDIIREYQEKYPDIIKAQIQIENQWSKGVRGIFARFTFPRCQGKYIALCEGDDYWTDHLKLQKQVDFLDANSEYSMCFHDAWVIKDNIKLNKYVNKDKTVFTTEDLFERHFIPTASIVFRNTIEIPNWYSQVQSGDRLLLFLISLKGNIKYLKDVMSIYRLHSEGISNSHFGIKKVYDSAILLNLFDVETEYKYTKECHKSLLYEIETHLNYNTISKQSPSSLVKSIKVKILVNEIIRRIKKKIKMLFR